MPALSAETDLEIVILTTGDSMPVFTASPAYHMLASIAPVHFLTIDHLVVPECQGVTLTLAYHYGVMEAGADVCNIHFVFLNADIILANGSLGSLARRIVRGDRVILANSIRANSEDVAPLLASMVDASAGHLSVPPRVLVGLALDAMHATQVAKIVNSDLCHSVHVNQFYWQVDAHTLISRHFLMFMLCLKPTRPVPQAEGFCDYVFVPEFCPDVTTTAFEDSDEFFALELQARDSENDYLQLGKAPPADVARSLARWTNAAHRHAAQAHNLTFHAQDIPPAAKAFGTEATLYINDLISRLPAEPMPIRRHPYWIGAHYAWQIGRARLAGLSPDTVPSPFPTPSTQARSQVARWLLALKEKIVARLVGTPPYVGIGHINRTDYSWLSRQVLRALKESPGQVLYLRDGTSGLFDARVGAAHVTTIENLQRAGLLEPPGGVPNRYGVVIAELTPDEVPLIRTSLDSIRPSLAGGAVAVIFIRGRQFSTEPTDVGIPVLRHVGNIIARSPHQVTIHGAGGAFKKLLHSCSSYQQHLVNRPERIARFVGRLLSWTMIVIQSLYNLQHTKFERSPQSLNWCSSITLVIRF
jgi:hypothetical protein